MTTPDVTVVVCTYNRAALLLDALTSLFALETDGRFAFELLVVDNASTDDTSSVVVELAAESPVPFRSVREMVRGVAAARNRGVREAAGRWVAFFDDDQVADPRWLAELMAFAGEKVTPCVGGANRLLLPNGTPADLAPVCRWMLGETMGGDAPTPAVGRLAPGAGNLLIHKDVFARVGVFDGGLKTAGEDGELFRRVEAVGIVPWYTPRAVMHHVVAAYRVRPDYLRWKSLGCGRLRAERDAENGKLRVAAVAAARLAHAVLVAVPLALWYRVRGEKGRALGPACLAWRAWGYFRTALRLLAPRLFPQRAFMERLEHRSERELFAEPSLSRDPEPAEETAHELATTAHEVAP
jgi:glycosyltransferase involved in cell wall biosynthesis